MEVHLDPMLTMETQIASVIYTTYFHLWRIAQLCFYLDVRALTTLVHALVVLRLDYCNVGLDCKIYSSAAFHMHIANYMAIMGAYHQFI